MFLLQFPSMLPFLTYSQSLVLLSADHPDTPDEGKQDFDLFDYRKGLNTILVPKKSLKRLSEWLLDPIADLLLPLLSSLEPLHLVVPQSPPKSISLLIAQGNPQVDRKSRDPAVCKVS